ncbi:hypothetical protein [Flexilinea flocculi]|jgi:hypothetical protein|uniref:Uncharacterized protein n=1 Tax=Flexilinea flocculi TaxID=1678840 RepID=A0A0S7BSZ7_9CHLR|nr:hypothetical protein [Flexilinea flocculi]GAP40102.1 hypothetical protein ATC1_1367 [Flexilinea flocculi]
MNNDIEIKKAKIKIMKKQLESAFNIATPDEKGEKTVHTNRCVYSMIGGKNDPYKLIFETNPGDDWFSLPMGAFQFERYKWRNEAEWYEVNHGLHKEEFRIVYFEI